MPVIPKGSGTRRSEVEPNTFITLCVSIERELVEKLDEHYVDPLTLKKTWGYRSQLISDLLRQHAEKLKLIPRLRGTPLARKFEDKDGKARDRAASLPYRVFVRPATFRALKRRARGTS